MVHNRTIRIWPTKLRSDVLHIDKTTRSFSASDEYIVIVNQYVKNDNNDLATVERAAGFRSRLHAHKILTLPLQVRL